MPCGLYLGYMVATKSSSTVSFSHRGEEHSLFKRPGQSNFSIRATVPSPDGGKHRVTKGLGTSDAKIAVKNAKLWLDAFDSRDWGRVEELRARSSFCSLGDMLREYEARAEACLRVNRKTQTGNVAAFVGLVAEGLGCSRASALDRRADVLSADLVRRFVAAARADGMADSGIASRLRKARSVVSPMACEMLYGRMKLPDLGPFRSVPVQLDAPADLGFRPFPEEVRERLESTMAGLRDVLPGVYLVYLAMARLGLRNCEVWNMRWCWFRRGAAGSVILEIRDRPAEGFATKTGEARDLMVPAGLWAELVAVRGAEREFFLPANTPTERRKMAERDINSVIRPILEGYRAGAYELRRWAGSIVWSTQGAEAAQRFLGHTSVRTTEKYYARFLRPISAVSVPDLDSVYGAAATARVA
jgi:integrase